MSAPVPPDHPSSAHGRSQGVCQTDKPQGPSTAEVAHQWHFERSGFPALSRLAVWQAGVLLAALLLMGLATKAWDLRLWSSAACLNWFTAQGLCARLDAASVWALFVAIGAGLFIATQRHARDQEHIALFGHTLRVIKRSGRRTQVVDLDARWVRVEPGHHQWAPLELSALGHHVSVGQYLRPRGRQGLAIELRRAVQGCACGVLPRAAGRARPEGGSAC